MALFDQISQMVAAARPKIQVGGRAPYIPPSVSQHSGYGELGERFGKGFGAGIEWATDPDRIVKDALTARQIISSFDDNARRVVINSPAVQAKFQQYAKVAPELFAPADVLYKDPSLEGKIDFVSPFRTAKENIERGEAGKPYEQTQEYRKGEADISARDAEAALRQTQIPFTQAQTEAVNQEIGLNKRLENIKVMLAQKDYDKAIAEIDRIRASTGLARAQTGLAAEEADIARRTKEARVLYETGRAAEYDPNSPMFKFKQEQLEKQREALKVQDEINKRNLEIKNLQLEMVKERRQAEDNRIDPEAKRILDSRREAMRQLETSMRNVKEFSMPIYAKQSLADTDAMVMGMGAAKVEKDGQTVYIPQVLLSKDAMFFVNRSIDDAFMAATGKRGSVSKNDIMELAERAVNIFEKSYGALEKPDIRAAAPPEIQAVDPKSVAAKVIYLQYLDEKANGSPAAGGGRVPFTPKREAQFLDMIRAYGGIKTPMTQSSGVMTPAAAPPVSPDTEDILIND